MFENIKISNIFLKDVRKINKIEQKLSTYLKFLKKYVFYKLGKHIMLLLL